MGGIRPDFDPVAALAKARARLAASQTALAKATFEPVVPRGASVAMPALPGNVLPPATPAPRGGTVGPASAYIAPVIPTKIERISQAVGQTPHAQFATGMLVDSPLRAVRTVQAVLPDHPTEDPLAEGVRAALGVAGKGLGWAQEHLEAPSGTTGTVARLGGNLAGDITQVSKVFGPAAAAMMGRTPTTVLGRVGLGVLAGAPLDLQGTMHRDLSLLGMAADMTDNPTLDRLAESRAARALTEFGVDALAGGLMEGVQTVRKPRPVTVNAEQAASVVANAPPPKVPRPPSQGVDAKGQIYENPDPIAEARAANPLTDTDPDRILARHRERTAPPIPPEAYAGPERRLASVSADDILNRHRRAADLPPTAGAPLVPREQSVTPRAGLTQSASGPTVTMDFRATEPMVPRSEVDATLERMAMEERAAASELAARELGEPPANYEPAPGILPMPKRGGGTKWVGGNPRLATTSTDDLIAKWRATYARAEAEAEASTRTVGSMGSALPMGKRLGLTKAAGGRAKVAYGYLATLEDELALRGVDFHELRMDTQANATAAEARRTAPAKPTKAQAETAVERFPDEWDESGDVAPRPKGSGRSKGPDLSSERGALGIPGGPGFKSRLVEAVKATKWDKAPARTWISKLRGQQSSADEFDWALGDALRADPTKQWTRAEVLALAESRGYGALIETVHSSASRRTTSVRVDAIPVGSDGVHRWEVIADRPNGIGELVGELRQNPGQRSVVFSDGTSDVQYGSWDEAVDALEGRVTPEVKYATYQEPGGMNYREVLLRVPERNAVTYTPANTHIDSEEAAMRSAGDNYLFHFVRTPDNLYQIPKAKYPSAQEAVEYVIREKKPTPSSAAFRSSHWDEPNVLAHIRMNDRVGPNGEKILHVEEIQSDWHQKGRKEGYARNTQGWTAEPIPVPSGGFTHWQVRDANGNEVTKIVGGGMEGAIRKAAEGIPNAPFKETPEWMGLAMKRVLDEAVAGGYDAVSWTPGAKQADRYSLRKVADEVTYHPATEKLIVRNKGVIVHEGHYDRAALSDVIGKEASDRLLATPIGKPFVQKFDIVLSNDGINYDVIAPSGRVSLRSVPLEEAKRYKVEVEADQAAASKNAVHQLTGEQLEIGGEGMKAFYDEMLPDIVRGYTKKLGAPVDIEPGLREPSMGTPTTVKMGDVGYEVFNERGEPYGVYSGASEAEALSAAQTKGPTAFGYDARPRNSAVPDAPIFRVTPKLRTALSQGQSLGVGGAPILSTVAGAGVGSIAGAATGDTPEERRRNALLGALAGGAAGAGLGIASERLGRRMDGWHASTPQAQAVLASVAEQGQPRGTSWLSWLERVKTHVQDETYPLTKLGRVLGGSDQLRDLVSQGKGWRGMAGQHLRDHLSPVLDLIKGREGDVIAYVKAQRALDILDRGGANKVGVPRDVLEETWRVLGQDPAIVAAAEGLQRYYRDLLELKHLNGVIDDAQYQAILASEDFYTPFVRDLDDTAPTAGGGKWVNRSTGIKRMDRTAEASAKTLDPVKMAVLHTMETHRAVAKQRVSNFVAALVETDPAAAATLLREVPAGQGAVSGNLVQANIHGHRKSYEVLDPDLYKAWAAMDPVEQNIVTSLLRPFKTLQTVGVTMLPDFMVANVLRDNAMSTIQKPIPYGTMAGGAALGAGIGAATSPDDRLKGAAIGAGLGLGLGATVPNLARSLGAMRSVIGNDDLYQQFLRDGGDSFGHYPRTMEDATKVLRELQRRGVQLSDIVNPKRWWAGLSALGRAAEQGPRLRAYAEAKGAGASVPASIRAARDISVDFSTVGSRAKGIAAVTAFWNAGVQGWDKTLRLLKDPKTHAMAAATITAPSLALWMLNKDNDEYWDVPQWERNLFWLVPKAAGGFYRIPKPFEVGFVFGSVPERVLDFLHTRAQGGDPLAAETLQRALTDMVSSTSGGVLPFPTLPEQVVSQIANYDFFRNRPIVSRPQVPGEEQYDERTSSLAYGVGQATGLSPQRIDFAVRQLTGGGGRVALDVSNQVGRRTGMDTRPMPEGSGNPFTRRFTTQPGAMSDQEMALRRKAREIEGVEQGWSKVRREGTPEAQRRYLERHRDILDGGRLTPGAREIVRQVDRMEAQRERDVLQRQRQGGR